MINLHPVNGNQRQLKKIFHQTSESPQAEDIHTKVVVEDFSIRLLAYQIHKKKGGTDLDNWYEAERVLSDNY